MPIQNFNFSQFFFFFINPVDAPFCTRKEPAIEYCDVINDANRSNNDNRHVITKGQHLLKEHFVIEES